MKMPIFDLWSKMSLNQSNEKERLLALCDFSGPHVLAHGFDQCN